MKTQAEIWNERAGAPIFATRCDYFGMPIGGWALPTFTEERDETRRAMLFVIGTFRMATLPGDLTTVEGYSFSRFLGDAKRQRGDVEGLCNDMRIELMAKLRERYEKENPAHAE